MNEKAINLIQIMFIIFLSTVLALAAGELIVRIFYKSPPMATIHKGRFRLSSNVKIAYEMTPNLSYQGDSLSYYDFHDKTNRMGFRGPDYQKEKPKNVYRIIVLGDSIAEGLNIHNYKDVFTARMERILNIKREAVQVMNFGVSGYNTQQEVETLKDKGLQFQPDLVVLAYCLNDTWGPWDGILIPLLKEAKEHSGEEVYGAERFSLLTHSSLFNLIYAEYLNYSYKRFKAGNFEFKKYDTGNTVPQYLDLLEKLAREHGFEVLVAVFPRFDEPLFSKYRFYSDHLYIKRLALAHHFYYLDLLPALTKCSQEKVSRVACGDAYHPNLKGHECVANEIASFVINRVDGFKKELILKKGQ